MVTHSSCITTGPLGAIVRSEFRHPVTPWGHGGVQRSGVGRERSGRVLTTYKPTETTRFFRDESSGSEVSLWSLLPSPFLAPRAPSAPLSVALDTSRWLFLPQVSVTSLLLAKLLVVENPSPLLPPLKVSLQNLPLVCVPVPSLCHAVVLGHR